MPSLRLTTNSPVQMPPALTSDMISSARVRRSSGTTISLRRRPIASSADQPYISSAARFQ